MTLPGFRTNVLWKRIIAWFYYIILTDSLFMVGLAFIEEEVSAFLGGLFFNMIWILTGVLIFLLMGEFKIPKRN